MNNMQISGNLNYLDIFNSNIEDVSFIASMHPELQESDNYFNYEITQEPLLQIGLDPEFTTPVVFPQDESSIVQTDGGDFTLLEDSPCIDSGLEYFEYDDVYLFNFENIQYSGCAFDIGAYEYIFDESPNCDQISGCIDVDACNYNPDATDDDGSCEYASELFDCDGVCLSDGDNGGYMCGEEPNQYPCPDGVLNVVDIIAMISIIIDDDIEYNPLADTNCDGTINVVDIVSVVSAIINQE